MISVCLGLGVKI